MDWTENHALTTESVYPYKGTDGTCNTSVTGTVKCTKPVSITAFSESALMASIETSPTSVAIGANAISLQHYSGGIYDPTGIENPCIPMLDHGVLAVGYGANDKGQNYYIVKNSWGSDWGDKGFIYFIRTGDGYGTCGI